MRETKNLTPLQIDFIRWLRHEYLNTGYEPNGRVFLKEVLTQGWYKEDESEWFNHVVYIYKHEYLATRKTYKRKGTIK